MSGVRTETKNTPFVGILIGLNVVVFALTVLRAGTAEAVMGVPVAALDWFGANRPGPALFDGRFETTLTSCFLHGSVMHIVFNMMALRQVGVFLERTVGPARFVSLYLAAGIAASAVSAAFRWARDVHVPSVGASGAICGLFGAALVLGVRLGGFRSALTRSVAQTLIMIFIIGFLPFVDNAAHVGGAVAGALIAMGWRRGIVYSPTRQWATLTTSLVLVLLAFVKTFAHDMKDPYALLDVEARTAMATSALARGDCSEAREALRRARAITRRASAHLSDVAQQINASCL